MIESDEAGEFMKEVREHDPNQSGVLDWDDEQYFADKSYVTNSHLKKLNEGGPQNLKAYFEFGQKETEAMKFGSAFHCLVLEPDEFDSRYYSVDDSVKCAEISGKDWKTTGKKPRSTKAYKEWIKDILDDNKDRIQLSLDDMDLLYAMQQKLMACPNAVQLLKNTLRERVYQNTLLGVPVKCKGDAVNTGNYLVDLKTMSDHVTEATARSAMYKYRYDQAGAFYRDVVGLDQFYFIFVSKLYPHTVGIFELGDRAYEEGKEKYEAGLKHYKYYFVEHKDEIDKHFIQGII